MKYLAACSVILGMLFLLLTNFHAPVPAQGSHTDDALIRLDWYTEGVRFL